MTLYQRACEHIPGGVNSPVRAFKGVGGEPLFMSHAKGAYIFAENNTKSKNIKYIDYVGSWGPMILGHAHPEVLNAVQKALQNGLSFGAPTVLEIELAELMCSLMPSIEMVRMVNSGTEATMSAIRLARGFTHKNKIIKFRGCYHGHSDSLLVKAGSGLLTLGIPDSAGVPASFVEHTLIAEFNDLASVEKLCEQYADDIAGIIVEPVAGNMNCILPDNDFLSGLREICDNYKALLIFDEVMTGFRVSLGGAQEKYNIKPDLTTLGKIIGGGMPVGAFGGRQEIMQSIAPLGAVYQAGTLSGNPIAMTAGLATLRIIQEQENNHNLYNSLNKKTQYFLKNLMSLAEKNNIDLLAQHSGSMFGIFFTEKSAIKNFSDVEQSEKLNGHIFKKFFHGMVEKGIYLAPSAFEAGFLSMMHSDQDIDNTLNAAEAVFKNLL